MNTGQLAFVLAVAAVAVAIVVRQIIAIRTMRGAGEARRFAAEIIDNSGEGIVVYDRELRYVLFFFSVPVTLDEIEQLIATGAAQPLLS